MSVASILVEAWSRFIDDAAAGFMRASARLRKKRVIQLAEQEDGSFLVTEWRRGAAKPIGDARLGFEKDDVAGPQKALDLLVRADVQILFSSSRFMFRSVELPRGADQFVDGVVRSQIDRLTPWTVNEAAYGWSPPVDTGPGRIAVTVAATSRAVIEPVVAAIAARHADVIRVSAQAMEGAAIPVLSERPDQNSDRRMRRYVQIAIGVAGLGLAASLAAWFIVVSGLDTREKEIEDEIAQRRSELLQPSGSPAERAAEALTARKRTGPSAVIVMEELSKALPDDAHLTELRLEDGKVQIVGLAQNAPDLIRLIEQSGQFSHATFFAPTVRAPNGSDTFHIEARPEPPFPQSN